MTPSNKSNAVTLSKQDAPARCWNNLGRGWTWHTETDYLWCCVCVCVFGNVLPVWATAAMRFVLFLEKKKRWGWDREKNRERGARWQRERLVCFQLIHFLPDVGSHLSWLETEHTAGILMTVRLLCALPSPPSLPTSLSHPHPLHLSSLHILYILSAQLISCLLSLSFSLPFFFTPPHLGSLPMQLHSADPNFSSHPSSPSIHLSIWPRSTSPAARSITYRLHYPAPFLLPHVFFRLALLPIPPLISPSALPRTALVFSALALRVLSFSVGLPSSSFGLPPVTFYVSLSSSPSLSGPCELIPGLCGSRGWWDVKSEVCILCVFLWQSEGRVAEGKQEVGLERDNYKKSTGQLRFGVQPGLDETCSVFSQLGC